jgi:hypothetical protein
MFSFEYLFFAVIFDCILKFAFMTLNVKINIKFGLKIFCDDMSGSLDTVLKEVFDNSKRGKFILKD